MQRPTASVDDFVRPRQRRDQVSSAVRSAASQLRDRILSMDEADVFLGSEEELVQQLSVSRPTFRQVARLLEHEQLLTIKRGPGGGFFTRRPSLDMVIQLASVCLVSRQARVVHMAQAGAPVLVEAARLAAALPDPKARGQLLDLLTSTPIIISPDHRSAFVRLYTDASKLLCIMSGNPVLEMFMHIVREFATEVRAGQTLTIEHMQRYLSLLEKLAHAIAEGDVEIAGIIAARLNTASVEAAAAGASTASAAE